MYRQVFIPNEQNYLVPIPLDWYGREVMILAYPITVTQTKEEKQFAWLNGNSRIDNPIYIGEDFKKIPRDKIYERKSVY